MGRIPWNTLLLSLTYDHTETVVYLSVYRVDRARTRPKREGSGSKVYEGSGRRSAERLLRDYSVVYRFGVTGRFARAVGVAPQKAC